MFRDRRQTGHPDAMRFGIYLKINSRRTERTSAWRPCRFLLMSDMVAMRPAGCGVSELIAGPGCWCDVGAGLCTAESTSATNQRKKLSNTLRTAKGTEFARVETTVSGKAPGCDGQVPYRCAAR